jgi:hypothetical protein
MANRPLGVTILAILYWLGTLILLLAFFAWDNVVREMRDSGQITQSEADDLIDAGWILLIPAIILFLLGLGLWKLVNVVRIIVIILAAIGVVGSLLSILQGFLGAIIQLLIGLLIIWYLMKDSTHKAFTS